MPFHWAVLSHWRFSTPFRPWPGSMVGLVESRAPWDKNIAMISTPGSTMQGEDTTKKHQNTSSKPPEEKALLLFLRKD